VSAARIVSAELLAVDLPLRRPFKHAAAERSSSESLFLRCVTDRGAVGFGECLPRKYVTGETREGAFDLLRHAVLPRLVGLRFASLAEVEGFLAECDGRAPRDWVDTATPHGAAWCAVDLALLDAFGWSFGARPLAGQAQDRAAGLRYSGVLSADGGAKLALGALKQRLFGLRQIKLKLSRETPDATARRVRRLCGERVELRVDANMSWSVAEALARIEALSRYGVRCFEQPVAADDLDGMARLCAETQADVMADESFTTRESLAALVAKRACTAVNARISKCGGLLATLARCREALAAGLDVQIGCQVGESSLLSSAQLLLADAVGRVRYAEGCFGRHLLREDPATPVLQFGFGGRPPARPHGPGLGVVLDERVLGRFATRRELAPRRR
jgi:L-alanine-DL-glutamate epimerase-like enolase superfamily enzyme